MGLRYIGSKARVANDILDVLGAPTAQSGTLVDAFCGTGSVAVAAAEAGWSVRLNDTLYSSVVMAAARLVSPTDARFLTLGGYASAIRDLNALAGQPGFVTQQYSPLSAEVAGVERRYFTVDNAARIDAIRSRIASWHLVGLLTHLEHQLLLADLMIAANQVANTAGTYGCFLREWSPVATRSIALVPRPLARARVEVTTTVGDVLDLQYQDGDVAYFDPPYTKRQYAAYYHLLETIAAGDEPEVDGVTGLRPWKHLASDYCYRNRAIRALDRLVQGCAADRILLSYSSEGHVSRPALEQILDRHGDVVVHRLGDVGRYRPNPAAARRGSAVEEYLFEVTRTSVLVKALA